MITQGIHVTSANVDIVILDVLQKLQRIESSLTVQLGGLQDPVKSASDL